MFRNLNYRREELERLAEETEQTKSWCRTSVSTWTENTLLEGRKPTYEGFIAENREFDHDELIDCIEAEMKRVTRLCKEVAG